MLSVHPDKLTALIVRERSPNCTAEERDFDVHVLPDRCLASFTFYLTENAETILVDLFISFILIQVVGISRLRVVVQIELLRSLSS